MFSKYKIVFLLFLLTLGTLGFTRRPQVQADKPCLSAEEQKLYELIMAYRKQKGLTVIPVSVSLTKVAQEHVRDLNQNAPHKKTGCNMHSWSKKGTWKACCYDEHHSKAECMWNKPREIANFDADGFEIAYGSDDANFVVKAENALASWKQSNGHNTVIINKGPWKEFAWKSIGVGIYKNFACVWFATKSDEIVVLKPCE